MQPMLQSKMQEQKKILDLYTAQAVSKGLLPAYTRTTHSSLNTQEQLLTSVAWKRQHFPP